MDPDSPEEEEDTSISSTILSTLGFQPPRTPRQTPPTPTPASTAGASSAPSGPPSVTMATSTSTSTTTPLPRIGGIIRIGTEDVLFSGGGCLPANRITDPLHTNVYRFDSDVRSIMKVEEACTKPLDEAKCIDEGVSAVTFSQWTNDVMRRFAGNGLDSIAYVLKPKTPGASLPDINDLTAVERECNEYNLFTEWGVFSKDDMDKWDVALKTSTCRMDKLNNAYARIFLRASVGNVLRERIDRELPIDVSGARLLYFIIRKLQAVSAVSGRQLVEQLQQIKLSSIPGCHVHDCAQKVHDVCTKLVGLGTSHIPTDLPILVMQCFDTTSVPSFDLEVTKIENDLDENPHSHTWKSILDNLTGKFDKLYLTKRWPPLDSSKTTVASGFAVQLEEVKKGLKDVKVAIQRGKPETTTGTTRDLSHIECHYCHQKGHYKSACPSLANKSDSGTKNTSSAPKSDKPKHWTRTPPSDNEAKTKNVTVEGKNILFKWCQTCKRWRSGPKAHLTDEHKRKNAPATTQAGHTLQSEGINFGLFAAETNPDMAFGSDFTFDGPIPGGFLECYREHAPPDDASDDDDGNVDWNFVREGEGTPLHRAKVVHPKGSAGLW